MKKFFKIFNKAIYFWLEENAVELISYLLLPGAGKIISGLASGPTSRFVTSSLWTATTVDGAVIAGSIPTTAGAKYALKKGLPGIGQRRLAIENEPHLVDGFSGTIKSGYGKGEKTLLADEIVGVKIKDRMFLSRMNYHFHTADKAGPHYDLVVAGVPEGTPQWELNIPRGDYKGRYSFVKTPEGIIVVPMKDRGITLAKPDYQLKSVEWLSGITVGPEDYIVEQKIDGSLGNFVIKEGRAVFHSHRVEGSTYYDKLPGLENLYNCSQFATLRKLLPYPELDNTVGKVELYHPDGVGRVSGILNALPERAHEIQGLRGNVTAYGWDLIKYKGKDISNLPYWERRIYLEKVIKEIRLFNKNWNLIDACKPGESPVEFYNRIISYGLPWGEGVVIKPSMGIVGTKWPKVKDVDFVDLEIIANGFVEGKGKHAGKLGALLAQNPLTGSIGEIGTGFSDYEREWIWRFRNNLDGAVIKAQIQEDTAKSLRAGVFKGFHESKGRTESGLLMYAESLAGGDPNETMKIKYKLINSR